MKPTTIEWVAKAPRIMSPLIFGASLAAIGVAVSIGMAQSELPAAQPRVTKQLLHDAFSVFTLTIAQEYSLAAIQEKYPDLRERVLEVRTSFERTFGNAVSATGEYLSQEFGMEWERRKQSINQVSGQIDASAFTRSDAQAYLERVKRRTKGDMPERIYVVLATLDPAYVERPHLEFGREYIREYKCDGSGKALGLKLALQYPLSWKESEGRRPHILRTFSTHDSFASCTLMVKKLPHASASMSVADALKYLASREYLEVELPDAGYISNGTTTIASQRSSFVDYSMSLSRSIGETEIQITTRARMYFLIYRGIMVVLAFDVCDLDGRAYEYVETEFKRRKTLFDLIALSLDIYNRYP